jgi:hypothetical protein
LLYQSTVTPEGALALKDDDEPVHTVDGVAITLVGLEGGETTVIVTLLQVALAHPVVVFRARAR